MDILFNVLEDLLSWQIFITMLIGITAGIVIGALPGLSANMGIALLIPITFVMGPQRGLLMLMALYNAAIYAGSIPAILFHTPGTSASAAATIDGYKLTQQGKSAEALRISLVSSVFGGIIGALSLLLFTPILSRVSLLFGPPEYFLLAVFALTAIASVSSASILRGLISGAAGLFLGTVGLDLITGFPRFTFGYHPLESGISVVPAMIGLFAFAQVFILSESEGTETEAEAPSLKKSYFLPNLRELRTVLPTIGRSSVIGILIGMLPGAGANVAAWVSYGQGKSWAKHPDQYGEGSIEGLSAAETAKNEATGASLIPLLTLGVPGGASAAVLFGALLMHGLVPGRELFTTHARLTYGIILGFLLSNILLGMVAYVTVRFMAPALRIPRGMLVPIVATLCVLGSYSVGSNFFDVWIMVATGILGYLMRKTDFSPPALLLGLILGPIAETGLRQSLTLSGDSLAGYVFTRPLSDILILLIIGAVAITVRNEIRRNFRTEKIG